jgi:hypothetical protein
VREREKRKRGEKGKKETERETISREGEKEGKSQQ